MHQADDTIIVQAEASILVGCMCCNQREPSYVKGLYTYCFINSSMHGIINITISLFY